MRGRVRRHGFQQVIGQGYVCSLLHYNIYNSFLGGCFTGNNSVFVKMFHVEHQIFASFYFVKAVEVLGEM